MLSVDEARALMLARIHALPAERVEIGQAYGRVLASSLIADRDQPPFASSAMDGYALASAPSPRTVEIIGESAAGRAFIGVIGPDQAVRISTGAPLPAGADGILIQEEAQVVGSRLLGANVKSGRHVRPRGGDFAAGNVLLGRGRRLDPVAIALAASAGAAALDVVRRPRITVFAGGDELAQPGGAAGADQIYESGSFALWGLIGLWGGVAKRAAPLPDDEAKITTAAGAALDTSDLVVLIGGASVGPHDHARAAMQRLGMEIVVPKIAVRPGKPTWFGASAHSLVLGLPGNSASAIVGALLFLRPILEAMAGRDAYACVRTRMAPLATALSPNGPRESYLRARLEGDGCLFVFDDQDSSLLSVLSKSNALVRLPPSTEALGIGDPVQYLPFGAD